MDQYTHKNYCGVYQTNQIQTIESIMIEVQCWCVSYTVKYNAELEMQNGDQWRCGMMVTTMLLLEVMYNDRR